MKTSIIPVFIPHIGCPHRCIFCNQWQITGTHAVPDGESVAQQIQAYTGNGQGQRHWEVAFYGGTFTAIPPALQEELLQAAAKALQRGRIQAIRCSTRPDCIDVPVLKRLQQYGLTLVELGVQSMDDQVLKHARRGHTAAQVVKATALLREFGFSVGHQLMPGLPGEDWNSLVATTEAVCRMKPDIARIYPVAVIDHTELAEQYRSGTYQPLSIHEGVVRAAYMKQAFVQKGIRCIRTGLQATADLDDGIQVLAGAYTPAMGELVDTRRYRLLLFSLLDTLSSSTIVISYHRRDTSRVRGYHNVTVKLAALRYEQPICWQEDNTLPVGTVGISCGPLKWQMIADEGTIHPVGY